MQLNLKKQNIFNIVTIVSIAIWSLIPHPVGTTPLLGCALFSREQNRSAFWSIWTLAPAIINDLLFGFHSTSLWVYLSLLVIVYLGAYAQTFFAKISASLIATSLFFIITNFGVWYTTALYPLSYAGLVACYLAAVPFLPGLLISTLCTTSLVWIACNRHFYLTTTGLLSRVIKN